MVNHKIIAHRGNLYGKSENENQIDYIQNAITQGFDAEIDLWYYVYSDKLYLGHDEPQYEVEYSWLNQYKNSLWIHCKCLDSLEYMSKCDSDFNYFWHENDKYILTSKGIGWVYPGNYPYKKSIIVMPEIVDSTVYNHFHFSNCLGVCTDTPFFYKELLEKV